MSGEAILNARRAATRMSDQRTVTHRSEELRLDVETYDRLKRLAYDDPVAAQALADELLAEKMRGADA